LTSLAGRADLELALAMIVALMVLQVCSIFFWYV
jgi:hypothetical protein